MRAVGASAAAWALALSASARAASPLEGDADRLASALRDEGMVVVHREAFFIEQNRVKRLALPPGALEGEGCVSIALLGVRTSELVLRSPSSFEPRGQGVDEPLARSAAGALSVTRCADTKHELDDVVLEMKGQRGAVEVIVARGSLSPRPLITVLPERSTAGTRPMVDPGRSRATDALAQRVAQATERARGDGAAVVVHDVFASHEGRGRAALALGRGCHRVEVLSERGEGGRVADVDAELRHPESLAVLTRDRADTPDARLEFCVADRTPVLVTFAGAPPGAKVAVLDERFLLAEGLDARWGPRAASAMGSAMLRRRAPRLDAPPIAEAQGVAGSAIAPFDVVPGRCYLAALALVRGETKGLVVSAMIEGTALRDDGGPQRDGAVVAFCSRRSEKALLRVEARGPGVTWVLALFATPATTGGAP